MRRFRLGFVMLMVTVLIINACGGGDSSRASDESSTAAASEEELKEPEAPAEAVEEEAFEDAEEALKKTEEEKQKEEEKRKKEEEQKRREEEEEKRKAIEEKRQEALQAYNDLLSGGLFNRDDPQGDVSSDGDVSTTNWDPAGCKFCIAYIDEDDIPELLIEGYPVDHVGGFGQLYTFENGRIVSIRRLSSMSSEAETGTQIGYYEKTGWMETFSMWQGYGDVCTEPMVRDTFWLRKHFEPGNNFDVRLVGYYVHEGDQIEECDEEKYNQELTNLGLDHSVFIPYEYYENTLQNREHVFGKLNDSNDTDNAATYSAPAQRVAKVVLEDGRDETYPMESADITAYDESGTVVWIKHVGPYEVAQADRIQEIGMANGLYYYIDDGILMTLNPETGEPVWENSDIGGIGNAYVFDADGTLYFSAYFRGNLVKISKDGKTENSVTDIFNRNYIWPYEMTLDGNTLTMSFHMLENSVQVDKNTFQIVNANDASYPPSYIPVDSPEKAFSYLHAIFDSMNEHQDDPNFKMVLEEEGSDYYLIRGYDDMSDHIATLFWYKVYRNGAVEDTMSDFFVWYADD